MSLRITEDQLLLVLLKVSQIARVASRLGPFWKTLKIYTREN